MSLFRLHFHGPFSICTDEDDVLAQCPYRDSPGIYLWAVMQPTGCYRIEYIGQTTTSFYQRTNEHVIQTLGGNYRILDVDQMRDGIQQIVWNGLWRRNTRTLLPEFIRRYETLAPLIRRYLLSELVFVAPIDCAPRIQRRIEGALARHIRSIPEACVLLPDDIRYVYRRSGEPCLTVSFSADHDIDGLPTCLEA